MATKITEAAAYAGKRTLARGLALTAHRTRTAHHPGPASSDGTRREEKLGGRGCRAALQHMAVPELIPSLHVALTAGGPKVDTRSRRRTVRERQASHVLLRLLATDSVRYANSQLGCLECDTRGR